MRIVRLFGELGKKFGRVHRLDVATPAEAIQALCANYPEFRHELTTSGDRGVAYRCVVDKEVADFDRLTGPVSREFTIAPVVCGAGKLGSALMVVAGIALVVFAGPIAGAIGASFITSSVVASIGVAVALSGIAQLLTPTPTANSNTGKTNTNDYFNGPAQTTAQGAPVPFGYGRMIVGSAVISAGITIEQQYGTSFVGGFQRQWL